MMNGEAVDGGLPQIFIFCNLLSFVNLNRK